MGHWRMRAIMVYVQVPLMDTTLFLHAQSHSCLWHPVAWLLPCGWSFYSSAQGLFHLRTSISTCSLCGENAGFRKGPQKGS